MFCYSVVVFELEAPQGIKLTGRRESKVMTRLKFESATWEAPPTIQRYLCNSGQKLILLFSVVAYNLGGPYDP
jgi:hypothetical protein